MSDSVLIRYIRLTPSLNKLWQRLEDDERRKVLSIAHGDNWHLEEIFEFVLEQRTETVNA